MSLPRMSLHIGDYRKDTGHLRAAGHGGYLLLIMHYWATGGLPDDDRQLAAIACMTDREWKQWRPVLAAFFGAKWKHKRIDEELEEAKTRYERRVNAGKKGGRPPKQSESKAFPLPKQPSTLSEKEEDNADDARAKGAIMLEGFMLADRLRQALGWDKDDPHAVGMPWVTQKWLNGGWNADLCVATVQQVKARSRKTINTLAYFETAIAEAHARQSAPLPVVVIDQTPEVSHVQAGSRHPGGAYGASKDKFRAAYDKLSEFADGGEEPDDSASRQGVVEILPAARRN